MTRILLLPVLFYPEPWNGIMEHLRLLVEHGDPGRQRFTLALRRGDGDQTAELARRTGVATAGLGDVRSIAETRRVCRALGVDLVHIHTPSTAGVAKVALGARLAGARVIVTYHQVQPAPLRWRSRLINGLAHRLLIGATIAVSSGVAATLHDAAGLDRDRIKVIHNGVDPVPGGEPPQAFEREVGDVWFGYFGRLAEEKGLPSLLDGVAAAKAQGAPVRLLVVGDGYERGALEQRADALGLGATVRFVGYRSDARLLMRSVDVVVHVPRFEGFGLALIEAMEAGRPVVASNVPGGIGELVTDGENGLLVPYGDPIALGSALGLLARSPEMRARLGANGNARYERLYRADGMVERTLAVYGE